MNCRICNNVSKDLFKHTLLQKHDIQYYYCETCGFIQTEEPYWLNEAYLSPIAVEDTGIIKRNLVFSGFTASIITKFFNPEENFLDYGAGYGLFVRIMRDKGFNYFWSDPYSTNLFARLFEMPENIAKYEVLTTFECFEHFVNPIEEIEKMLELSDTIIFSTELFNPPPPKPENWAYYSFRAGQHISLFSEKTLRFISEKFNLNLNTNKKSFHMFSKKKINNNAFNFLLKASYFGLDKLLTANKKSLTDSDMQFVLNKLQAKHTDEK